MRENRVSQDVNVNVLSQRPAAVRELLPTELFLLDPQCWCVIRSAYQEAKLKPQKKNIWHRGLYYASFTTEVPTLTFRSDALLGSWAILVYRSFSCIWQYTFSGNHSHIVLLSSCSNNSRSFSFFSG